MWLFQLLVESKKRLSGLFKSYKVREMYRKGKALSCPPMNVVLGNLNTRSISFSSVWCFVSATMIAEESKNVLLDHNH